MLLIFFQLTQIRFVFTLSGLVAVHYYVQKNRGYFKINRSKNGGNTAVKLALFVRQLLFLVD